MKKVYIASPYTKGDQALNVRIQMEVADVLIENGFAPFIPLLTHFQHIYFPRSYNEWLVLDMEWLAMSDILLRLPGESKGADKEVEKAEELNIKIYYDIDELIEKESEDF